MSKMYKLTVPRKSKDDKTYWDNIGVMFKRDKGGYSIVLNMFPDLKIFAFPPKDDDNRYENKNSDEVPF